MCRGFCSRVQQYPPPAGGQVSCRLHSLKGKSINKSPSRPHLLASVKKTYSKDREEILAVNGNHTALQGHRERMLRVMEYGEREELVSQHQEQIGRGPGRSGPERMGLCAGVGVPGIWSSPTKSEEQYQACPGGTAGSFILAICKLCSLIWEPQSLQSSSVPFH